MSKSKLGPIPDDHFENDPQPPGTYPGKWSKETQAEVDAETARLKKIVNATKAKSRQP